MRQKETKKTLGFICTGIFLIWFIISAIWYVQRDLKYSRYTDGMEKSVFSTWLVPNYNKVIDGAMYAVKYPDYLSTVGNLSVAPEDNSVIEGLIIWPLSNNEYEYGLILNEDNTQYQIYIDCNGKAVNPGDALIVNKYSAQTTDIINKAHSMWNLN